MRSVKENEMGISKWLVAAAAMCGAAHAQAQAPAPTPEKTMAYITPFGGYTHLKIDPGRIYSEPDEAKLDAFQLGAAFGFRWPFGLMIEVAHSASVHAELFNSDDFDLEQNSGAVGWRIPFADGWHFIPKVGREHWTLSSNHRVLLDEEGERHKSLDDWSNFWELGLTREINRKVSLGVNFRDVDEQFGHSRSGTFVASFAF
jgi:hypothetical protein